MTKLQMLKEMNRCFQIALEGGLTAAQKNSLDTRFCEFLLTLQEAEIPKHNRQILAEMKWATK